jgi:hypothetical protein
MPVSKNRMDSNAVDFPRINLPRLRIVELRFSAVIQIAPDPERFPILAALQEGGQFAAFTAYSREKRRHLIGELAYALPNQPGNRFVQVVYDASSSVPEGKVPRELAASGALLTELEATAEVTTVTCHVDFHVPFDVGAPTGLAIGLPIPISPADDGTWPITELRGVRGVKLTSGTGGKASTPEYSFILDRPENDDVFLSLDFQVDRAINRQTPEHVVARATSIGRSLGIFQ